MYKTRKMVVLALLTSIGIVLGIIESMIPLPIAVPGAKLGLSNIVQLIVIVIYGSKEGITVGALKSLLIAVGTGRMGSLMYSLPAVILSTMAMILIYKYFSGKFSLIGVSIIGALVHNFTQILVASIVIENTKIFTYYPIMSIVSLFTGYVIGIVSKHFILYVKNMNLEKVN